MSRALIAAAVRESREPLGGGQDGVEALRLVYAAYAASQNGSVVRV